MVHRVNGCLPRIPTPSLWRPNWGALRAALWLLAHLEANHCRVMPMAIGWMPPELLFKAKRCPTKKNCVTSLILFFAQSCWLKIDTKKNQMVAMVPYATIIVLEKDHISCLKSYEEALIQECCFLLSSVMVVIHPPIFCISSIAISCQVPAVSMADG